MKNIDDHTRHSRSRGFLLIELLLVMEVISSIAVAAFVIYPRAVASRDVAWEIAALNQARSQLMTTFTRQDYDKLTTAVARNLGALPDSLNDRDTGYKYKWAGVITFYPSNGNGDPQPTDGVPDRLFAISVGAYPDLVCQRVVAGATSNFGAIRINDNPPVFSRYATPRIPMDEAAVASQCAQTPLSSVIFVSE